MSDVAARIAAASGDAGALLTLAIELANENARLAGHAAALEQARAEWEAAEEERKAKQASRTRKHRNAASRDVTLQAVTERDGEETPSPSSPPSLLPPVPPNNSSPPSPPSSPRTIRTTVSPPRADVEAVVAHYLARHPKRRPGSRDRALIARHLATYSPAELCEAIDGNADDEWAQRTGKHELAWVLRDNGQIDTYRAKAETPAVKVVDGWFADVAS